MVRVILTRCSQKSDWNSAYDLCRNLARDCAEMFIWDPVAEFALSGALKAHNQLAAEQGEEYLNLALAYLRVQALHSGSEGKEDRSESESLTRDVLDTLRSGLNAQLGKSARKVLPNSELTSGASGRP